MLNIMIFLLTMMGALSLLANTSNKCGDVVNQVEAALKSFHVPSRSVPDDASQLRSTAQALAQDASYLEVRAGRALKDPSTREQARLAAGAKLKEINTALEGMDDLPTDRVMLHQAKAGLLKLKYLGDRPLDSLDTAELSRIRNDLSKDVGGLAGVPKNMAAEAEFKKAVEAELRKRPDYQQAQSQTREAVAESVRQQQRQAEINFRNGTGNQAAKTLSDAEKIKIESYVVKLRENPKSLTSDEVKELRQIQQSLSEKQKWKSGSYSGMTSTDLAVATNLEQALNQASRSINEGSVQVLNLAQQQGRAIQPAKADNFGTDVFGRHTGSARLSTQAERKAQGAGHVAIKELESAGTRPTGSIEEIAAFRPVVTERAAMNNISSSLSRVGIQVDEVRAANVVSTLNAGDVDGALVDFRKAQDFLRQVREARRSGELQRAAQTLTDSERRSLNQLIETMEAHQRSYVPSHLRNLRDPASP